MLDRMRAAIRSGTFDPNSDAPATPTDFNAFADLYVERYVQLRSLRSESSIKYRLGLLRARFGSRQLAEIRIADVEDLVRDLKADKKNPATINRHLALLRAMLNWAIEREYLEHSPFRRGSRALIKLERENNRRSRRIVRRGGESAARQGARDAPRADHRRP